MDTSIACIKCGQAMGSTIAGSQCVACLLELASDPEGVEFVSIDGSGGRASRFLRAGTLPQFKDYVLHEEIARGGMGVVYRAEQISLKRPVAIKMILAGQLATTESVQRFRTEAEAAAKLDHPGIVPIYEVGEYETLQYFSMKLIDGANLAQRMSDFVLTDAMSVSAAREQQKKIASLLARVARALAFAHERGVLHRDVKPGNILVDRNDSPYLIDFGLAKLTGHEASGLTLSAAILGSPSYMAPEQALGDVNQVTTLADVYGLGAVLYELLTGLPPFLGDTALATMQQLTELPPQRPSRLNASVHPDLETISLKCLEKKPEQRYSSAAQVADELDRFIRDEPIIARRVGSAETLWRLCRRKPLLASLLCALLLSIVIGGGTALRQWLRAERANVQLTKKASDVQWESIDVMLQSGQSSRALSKVAWLLRERPDDWKAAMFGISLMEQRRFPVPLASPIKHSKGLELCVGRLSPDGRRVVTAGYDGTARIWDTLISQQLLPALPHDAVVNWAEFSPDGERLATCSADKTVRLWEVATGKSVYEPLLHERGVLRVHFSADGRHLLTVTDQSLSVFEANSGQRRLGPLRHEGRIVAAKFIQDGKYLFSAQRVNGPTDVQVWEVATGIQRLSVDTDSLAHADITSDLARLAVISAPQRKGYVLDLANSRHARQIPRVDGQLDSALFSPGGDRVAFINVNHWARVWDTQTLTPTTPELTHYYLLGGVGFLENGSRLLTWGDDALAQVWDVESGDPFCEPMRHVNRVQHAEAGRLAGREVFLTTLSHGKDAAKRSGTGSAQVWQIHQRSEPVRRTIGSEPFTYDGGILSSDGKWIALAKTNEEVWVLEAASGKPICGPLAVHGGAWGLLFTPNADRLITTTSKGQIAIWKLPEGELLCEPTQLPTTIQPVAMTADGHVFATGSTDGFARLWDAATGELLHAMRQGSEINSVAFSRQGDQLASAGENGVVRIWDATTGQLERELRGHTNEVMTVEYGPRGRQIVTASLDFSGRIWDAMTGKELSRLPHRGEVLDATFSPDGMYIATAARDRTAIIWNADTGIPHTAGLLHEQAVRNVRFSPDGLRLCTLDFRGLRLWDVQTGHPLTAHLPQLLQGGTGFQSSADGPAFTPDGNSLYVATDSTESLIWHVPVPPPGVPAWFPDFLDAVAGLRLGIGIEIPANVSPAEFLSVRDKLQSSQATDFYTSWAKEWLTELESD